MTPIPGCRSLLIDTPRHFTVSMKTALPRRSPGRQIGRFPTITGLPSEPRTPRPRLLSRIHRSQRRFCRWRGRHAESLKDPSRKGSAACSVYLDSCEADTDNLHTEPIALGNMTFPTLAARNDLLVLAQHAQYPALDRHMRSGDIDRLHLHVGGLQPYHIAFRIIALESGFRAVHESDDDVALAGCTGAL